MIWQGNRRWGRTAPEARSREAFPRVSSCDERSNVARGVEGSLREGGRPLRWDMKPATLFLLDVMVLSLCLLVPQHIASSLCVHGRLGEFQISERLMFR